ncbi:hypothetical protein NDU88_001937, partial [Pleurodeles waltl]
RLPQKRDDFSCLLTRMWPKDQETQGYAEARAAVRQRARLLTFLAAKIMSVNRTQKCNTSHENGRKTNCMNFGSF